MAFLQARTAVDTTTGCWNWTGPKNEKGYGVVNLARGQKTGAHRLSWKLHKGAFQASLLVCHTCDNRLCVNPDHLFLGTDKSNSDDMMRKGRHVVPLGEAHGKSILTDAGVLDMRKRYSEGETQTSIARLYGVSIANVNYIVRRVTWRHI